MSEEKDPVSRFERDLVHLILAHDMEGGIPAPILAHYLLDQIMVLRIAIGEHDDWYGYGPATALGPTLVEGS